MSESKAMLYREIILDPNTLPTLTIYKKASTSQSTEPASLPVKIPVITYGGLVSK